MLSITLDKPSYWPGDTVKAVISIKRGKPVKARGVYATLYCTEKERHEETKVLDRYDFDREKELGIPYDSHMKTTVVERTKEKYSQEKKVAGEGEFSNAEVEASFVLPSDAGSTSLEFGHDNKIVRWKLKAKLDIPMAPDDSAEVEVQVAGL